MLDSALFHSLPVGGRERLSPLGAPGGGARPPIYLLVFAEGVFPDELDTKPNEVDEDELRTAVST